MLVKLLAYTPEPDKLVAAAAKLCYSDAHIETIMDGLTPEKTDAFLKKLIPWDIKVLPNTLTSPSESKAYPERFLPKSHGIELPVSAFRVRDMFVSMIFGM